MIVFRTKPKVNYILSYPKIQQIKRSVENININQLAFNDFAAASK